MVGAERSEAERRGLERAYEQGLRGRSRKWPWLHNLGHDYERALNAAYERGKREKIRLAIELLKQRPR